MKKSRIYFVVLILFLLQFISYKMYSFETDLSFSNDEYNIINIDTNLIQIREITFRSCSWVFIKDVLENKLKYINFKGLSFIETEAPDFNFLNAGDINIKSLDLYKIKGMNIPEIKNNNLEELHIRYCSFDDLNLVNFYPNIQVLGVLISDSSVIKYYDKYRHTKFNKLTEYNEEYCIYEGLKSIYKLDNLYSISLQGFYNLNFDKSKFLSKNLYKFRFGGTGNLSLKLDSLTNIRSLSICGFQKTDKEKLYQEIFKLKNLSHFKWCHKSGEPGLDSLLPACYCE